MWRGWEIVISGRFCITVPAFLLGVFASANLCAITPKYGPIVTESLEWIILDSQAVIVGRIRVETPYPRIGIAPAALGDLLIDVGEVIKGPVKPGERLRISWSAAGAGPLTRGEDVLLCLGQSADDKSSWKLMPHRYILLNDRVPVTQMNFQQIQTREDILAAARRVAGEQRSGPLKSHVIYLPRFALHLRVPIDQRLEELAQQWLARFDLKDRLLGVQAIKPFKSSENLAAVKRLLADTRAFNDHGHGKWKRGFYAVRADACDLLGDWGEPVPDIPLGGPIFRYEPLPLWRIWPPIAAIFVSWIIAYIYLRRRRVELRFLPITLATIALAVAAFAIAGWLRSHHRVDELLLTRSSQYQIASYDGGMQLLVAKQWPHPSELALGSFDREIHEDFWSLDRLSLTWSKKAIGFAAAKGRTLDADGATHHFTLVRIPYWLLLIPGAAVILRIIFLLLRSWRRRRRGLCQKCGYDIRTSTAGKCPECGAVLLTALQAGDKVPVGGQSIGV